MTILEVNLDEGRYHRQELISWWDQARLRAARVLVVGAGALGNEIVKNLALLGVGSIEIVDMDKVEYSNLARCVLFADTDRGRFKAEVVAERAAQMNPDVRATARSTKVERLGLGYLRHFDLVIAGLDNREARLWVGTSCRKLGMTWVDGAIEGLRGLVRVFPPTGACYECTLGEADRAILSNRRSCALLSVEQMQTGHVPTNATTASVIAAIQVQEAVKLLVGRDDLVALFNRAFHYTGDVMDTYAVDYVEDEYCISHDHYANVTSLELDTTATARDVLSLVAGGAGAVLGFEDDLIVSGTCHGCGNKVDLLRFKGALRPGSGECSCGTALTLEAVRTVTADDPIAALPLHSWDPALEELVTIRTPAGRRHVTLNFEGRPTA